MNLDGWNYYNHAVIPTTAPHEMPNLAPIEDGSIWKIRGGTPLLARWTTDFDCGRETNWWYVIKDTPFDISELKAKRRYEINKGIKHFEVRVIDPCEYKEALYQIQVDAFSVYPESYRPTVDRDAFLKTVEHWSDCRIFGAFVRESGELVGYAMLNGSGEQWINFSVLKTKPSFEKYGLNAALVEKIVSEYDDFLRRGGMICDGARSIHHQTNFQDYLEKYFGFRKAYCRLHVVYHPKIRWAVRLLFPFRKLLAKADGKGGVHQINSVLKMEEICRGEK